MTVRARIQKQKSKLMFTDVDVNHSGVIEYSFVGATWQVTGVFPSRNSQQSDNY